jgi:propionyl-CoA carboxylase alpha chain
VGHNTAFLAAVMDQERFRSGALSTRYIADEFPGGFHGLPATPWQRDLFAAAAAYMNRTLAARARRTDSGLMGPVRADWVIVEGGERRPICLAFWDHGLEVRFTGEDRVVKLEDVAWRPGSALFSARLDGREFTATVTPAAEGFTIRHRAAASRILVLTPVSADLHERLPAKIAADTSRLVVSPMPGLVISADVAEGRKVEEGQVLFVIEAMKMQNIIRAERDGVLKTVSARAGDSVAADDILAEFA